MDVKKALLWMTICHFFVILIKFHEKWEEERRARERESMFFFQQLQVQNCAYLQSTLKTKARRKKRCWVKKRSHEWWERVVKYHFTEQDWLENFRMSYGTFKYICQRLQPYIKLIEFCERQPISVEKKVVIALCKLASCAEYRVVANQFGTLKSVVDKCVHDVFEALFLEFKDDYLSLPNAVEAQEITFGFENMCGIPNVIGAIDGTHIPVLPPTEGYRDFVNRKGWPSYNMMAVVDHLYRFKYATCQHAGSSHDASVLKDSNLYKHADKHLPQSSITIEGTEIPCMLLGDPAYPLLPCLMKGYRSNATPEEESFNVYLSRGRAVVENAFGRLKARSRCLSKRVDVNYKFVPNVVMACLILHNIIETRKDSFIHKWLETVEQAELEFPQPRRTVARDYDDLNGSRIRDALKNYMSMYPQRRSRLL